MRNKFPGWCLTCRCRVPAEAGHLAGKGEDGRWRVACSACLDAPDPSGSGDSDTSAYDDAFARFKAERAEENRQARLKAEDAARRLEQADAEDRRVEEARIRREEAMRSEEYRRWNAEMLRIIAAYEAQSSPPACMRTLGVDPPFTEEKVKNAFRARAKRAHPDHGGSAAEFIKIRHAYSDALRLVGGPTR